MCDGGETKTFRIPLYIGAAGVSGAEMTFNQPLRFQSVEDQRRSRRKDKAGRR
jgi:hypothetical protein